MANRRSSKEGDTSPSKILDAVYAFRQARVLLTAFEMDVFTILSRGAKTSAEVAEILLTNARAMDRLMNALCAMGFLRKKSGKFASTALSARYLVRGKPDYLAGVMHSVNLWETWSTLTDAVRNGSRVAPRERRDGSGENWLEAFIAAMHMRAARQASSVIKLLDLKGINRVLDMGGGSGAFSMAFVHAKKGIYATVFDLPNVTHLTQSYIDSAHLGDLINTVNGDYTVDSLGEGFDLVFLSAVIHSNSVETNKRLFKRSYDALNPDGRIVVLDFIMNEDRTMPLVGVLFSLNMLVNTSEGDTYTGSEVRGWMQEAGFGSIQKRATLFDTSLMIGRKGPGSAGKRFR